MGTLALPALFQTFKICILGFIHGARRCIYGTFRMHLGYTQGALKGVFRVRLIFVGRLVIEPKNRKIAFKALGFSCVEEFPPLHTALSYVVNSFS